MLEWRLKAYRRWLTMKEPHWPNVTYPPIDYQASVYYSAPKSGEAAAVARRSRSRAAAHVREARHSAERAEAARRRGRRRDLRLRVGRHDDEGGARRSTASSSARSAKRCASIPSSSRSISARSCPYSDNFFAALNAAVFSDGSFVYVPKGVRCPMELSTYFRINAADTGQFERTLIIADEGAYVSYLEGCTAPKRDDEPAARGGRRARRARRRDDQVLDRAELVRRRRGGRGRHLQLRDEARQVRRRELEDLVDAGRDRLGDHVEVSERDPAGRQLDR